MSRVPVAIVRRPTRILWALIFALLLLPFFNGYRHSRHETALLKAGSAMSDQQIEEQISELTNFTDEYCRVYGAYFSPAPMDEGTDRIIAPEERIADQMLSVLVANGTKAVPHLIDHLQDARKTRLCVVHDGFAGVMSYEGEYDAGCRQGVTYVTQLLDNRGFGSSARNTVYRHTLTVGDLCYAALGQIVDRNFNPIRYQPTACIYVNSPTATPAIAARAKKDWAGLTPEKHRQSLIEDVHAGRRDEGILRLAYYYPEAAEGIALEELRKPLYSSDALYSFYSEQLNSTGVPAQWEQLTSNFLANHPPAYKDALLEQLLSASLEADQGVPIEKQDPRKIFDHVFRGMDRKKWPRERRAIDDRDQTQFIRAMRYLKSTGVDEEIYRIWKLIDTGYFGTDGADGLAWVCMERLAGKGHDAEFISFCQRRARLSKPDAPEWQKLEGQLRDGRR